ncbi:MAG: hypothetical protein WAW73_20485 [Rhodoferax sp.]
MTEALERLKAYRNRLKSAGKLREAAAVTRCMVLIRQQSGTTKSAATVPGSP